MERGTYQVRTIWKGAPLPKVRVQWWRQLDDAAPIFTSDTIRFGTALFRPTSGLYYVTADWRPDNDFSRPRKAGDRFAWFGGNPLLVSSEIGGTITLTLEEIISPPSVVPAGTGISGKVTVGGVPTSGVAVYAYTDSASAFKGTDFKTMVRTNATGEFDLPLPAGKYYLIARLRGDNSVELGPLHKGDLLGFAPSNPVIVENGRYSPAVIPAGQLKMVRLVESPEFRPAVLEGRIVDRQNQPISGVHVALYDNPKMTGRPLFRSEPTGADGFFQLSVRVPGKYFFSAKSGYGNTTITGGWYGAYHGTADNTIEVKTGESITGLLIVVERPLPK